MTEYDIRPKPKVWTGSVHSPVKENTSFHHSLQQSAERSVLVLINYITKLAVKAYLFVKTENSFRSVSVNLVHL